MSDFVAVLGAVLLLGALVGSMVAMYRQGLASHEAAESEGDRSQRRDQIVELAVQLEDRNNYIARLRMSIDQANAGECPLLVKMPETPEWLVEDERI